METAVYLTGSAKEQMSMKGIRPYHTRLIPWDEVETAVYLTGSAKEGMSMEGIRPRHVRLNPWAAECRFLMPRSGDYRYDSEDCGTTLSAGMTLRIVVLH